MPTFSINEAIFEERRAAATEITLAGHQPLCADE